LFERTALFRRDLAMNQRSGKSRGTCVTDGCSPNRKGRFPVIPARSAVQMMPRSGFKDYYEVNSADHGHAIQSLLGRQLRTMYESLVHEDIPDRFTHLLRELDRRENEGER